MAKQKFSTGLRRLAGKVAGAIRRALGGRRRDVKRGMTPAEQQILEVAETMASGRQGRSRRPIPVPGSAGESGRQQPPTPPMAEPPLPSERDIREAAEVLEKSGWDVNEWGELEPPQPSGTAPQAPTVPTIPSVPTVPNAGGPGRGRTMPDKDDWGPELNLDTRLRLPPDVMDPRHMVPVWTLTPQSSNVYAFAYDREHGLLYIVFKKTGENGRKVNEPGPMYSYGSAMRPVPVRLYQRLVTSASKGRFVWDHLRIRGTVYGHQYVYTLVSPGPSGYVPRKATRRGYRVRTVPVVRTVDGRKRTSLVRSQLPERLFGSPRRRRRQ